MAILDSISTGTVEGAWSIARKVRTAYAGHAIKVSRSPYASPADELDVGFDGSGNLDKAACVAWGSNLRVLKIYDQSGGGVDVSPSGGYATLDLHGSRPQLDFGDTALHSIRYSSTGTVNLTAPKRFFVVDYHHVSQGYLADFGTGNTFLNYVNTSALLTQYNGSNVSYGSVLLDGPTQLTSWSVTGNDSFRMNGADLSGSGSANAGDTAASGVVVHIGNYGGSSPALGWTGELSEYILIDGALSTGDRDLIEADQDTYYRKNKILIGIGDSLTFGYLLADFHLSYPKQLQLLLADGWDSWNRGITGHRLDEIQSDLTTQLSPYVRSGVDKIVVVVNGGYNDFYQGASTATVQSRFTSLINAIKALGVSAGVTITIIVRPMPPSNFSGQPAGYSTFRDTVNAWLATQVGTLFNKYANSTADGHIGSTATTSDTTYFQSDQLHRTVAGYAAEAPYAVFSEPVITTVSLPNGVPGVNYDEAVTVTGGTAPITFSKTAGTASVSIDSSTGHITETSPAAGSRTITFIATGVDGFASAPVTLPWSIVVVPPGVISKYLVPRDGLHLWWSGDESPNAAIGSNITSLRDLTGNGFDGTPTGTGPLVDVLTTGFGSNDMPGLLFTGASPVRNTTPFDLHHLFVVADWIAGNYTVDRGLVTGTATNGILQALASGSYVNFKDNGYGANQEYRKAGVVKVNSAMTIASSFSNLVVYEVTLAIPLSLSGIQIGADRAVGSTSLWPGRVYELLPYTRVLNDTERARIYSYFTRKYHAWEETRYASTDYPVFPVTCDWGSAFEDSKLVLGDNADAGSRSTRTKFGLRRQYDLKFSRRMPDEYFAVKAFYNQLHPDGKFAYRDRAFYPYEERESWFTIDAKLKATPNGHINFDIETTLQDVNEDGAFG